VRFKFDDGIRLLYIYRIDRRKFVAYHVDYIRVLERLNANLIYFLIKTQWYGTHSGAIFTSYNQYSFHGRRSERKDGGIR